MASAKAKPLSATILSALRTRADTLGDEWKPKDKMVEVRCFQPEKHKNGDAHPSAAYTFGKYVYCRVCGFKEGERKLAERLGVDLDARPGGLTLEELAEAKALPVDLLQKWGWRTQKARDGRATVVIPWYGKEGVQRTAPANHLRHYINKGDKEGPRFTWDKPKNVKLMPYGAWRIREWLEDFEAHAKEPYVLTCESELDTVSFWLHTVPANAYGGADFWRSEWASHYKAFSKVFVCQEPGVAGERAARQVALDILKLENPPEVFILPFSDDAKDANALHRKAKGDPEAFEQALRSIIERAVPAAHIKSEVEAASSLSPEELQEGYGLLGDPNLVDLIVNDLDVMGVVGERDPKLLQYLIATSRKMLRPLGSAVRNPSSFGKDNLVRNVARLLPEEEVMEASRLTPQALHYWKETGLKGKWLIVTDREAVDNMGSVRILFSEGSLRVHYPTKAPEGNIATVSHRVEGPLAYTDIAVTPLTDVQDSSRFFEIALDGSKEQTERIHDHQRQEETLEGIRRKKQRDSVIKRHRAAQRLLRPNLDVLIPFAQLIRFPSGSQRMRRELPRFLNLVKAVAFIRQRQKPEKEYEGVKYIEADIEDYRVAYKLFVGLAEATLNDLNAHSLSLLKGIANLYKPGDIITRRDIVRRLKVRPTFVRDYIEPVVDGGYLEVSQEGGKGKAWSYKLVGQTPQAVNITSPEELEEAVALAQQLGQAGVVR